MTWTWTLTKIGVGISLGFLSSNPIGLAIGIPGFTLIKLKNEKDLNSSNLTLSDKVEAQRIIEIATDYRNGACLGIAFKGAGAIVKEVASAKTLSLGKEAGKEIAIHGFETELAELLIFKGQIISELETFVNLMPEFKDLKDKIKDARELIEKINLSANEEEFIKDIKNSIKIQNLLLNKIEENLNEEKNLTNNVRENTLVINKENVDYFIKYEKSKNDHRMINREINQLLKRIKKIQKRLHDQNNCCEECRFC